MFSSETGEPRFAGKDRCFAISAHARTGLAIWALALVLPAGAASSTLQPFSTDGCSRFPDRAPAGKVSWCHCCLTHDLAYWRGGTSEARLKADQVLKDCVRQASGSEAMGELVFRGVRAGGGPYFSTSYRWGYGWPFGRSYAPLTPEEEALAASLEQAYVATNPLFVCPVNDPAGE